MRLNQFSVGDMMKNKYFNYSLALYVFLIPFEEALNLGFGSLLRIIGIFVIFAGIFNLKAKFSVKLEYMPFILWMILFILSFFWSTSTQWWLYYFQVYFTQFVLISVLIMFNRATININRIFNTLIYSSVLSSIILFIPGISAFTDEGRRTIILYTKTLDPNVLASFLALTILIILDRLVNNNRKYINLLSILIVLCGVFLTGSRGTLISLIFGSIIYITYYYLKYGKIKSIYKYSIIILVGIIIIFYSLPNTLLDRFTLDNLIGLNELDPNVHSRYTIWSFVPGLFKQNPIFGFGGGNFMVALDIVYRQSASHNIYLLTLVELGIIGFFILGTWVSMLFYKAINLKSPLALSLTFTLFGIGFFIDSLSFKFFWIFLAIVYIVLNKKEIEMHAIK